MRERRAVGLADEVTNRHLQAVSKAISGLFNEESVTPQEKVRIVASAYRYAAIADWCRGCPADTLDASTWPHHVDEDSHEARYLCPRCGKSWSCWWASSGYNPLPEGWALDSRPTERTEPFPL